MCLGVGIGRKEGRGGPETGAGGGCREVWIRREGGHGRGLWDGGPEWGCGTRGWASDRWWVPLPERRRVEVRQASAGMAGEAGRCGALTGRPETKRNPVHGEKES